MKLFALILFAFLVFPAQSYAAERSFSDVNESTNYNDSIDWLSDADIVIGYPDGTFKPDQCVNRAEFVKLVTLTSSLPYVPERTTDKFPDVRPSDWFYTYVGNAFTLSWIQGYPDGTFKPGNCVNRVEAIKMALWGFNIDHYPVPDIGWPWADVKHDAWYSSYFYTAIDKSLLPLEHVKYTNLESGWPSNYYYPDRNMTRAEVAEMLYRMYKLQNESKVVPLEDDVIKL
jgi:hypothetical protein